jgi:hypothetical protein
MSSAKLIYFFTCIRYYHSIVFAYQKRSLKCYHLTNANDAIINGLNASLLNQNNALIASHLHGIKKGNNMENEIVKADKPAVKTLEGGTEQTNIVSMIKDMKSAGIDTKDIKEMLDLQIMLRLSQEKEAYGHAMSQVQEQISLIKKGHKNDHTNSKYAKLEDIILATKDIYSKAGISISFYEGEGGPVDHVRVCADITRGGHTVTRHLDVPLDGAGIKGNANMTKIHGKASSISYGRRYLMCLIFNIPTGDDDDGNGAGNAVQYINEEQTIKIEEWIQATKTEKTAFLAYLKTLNVESIEKIPVQFYQRIIIFFKEKEKRGAKKP